MINIPEKIYLQIGDDPGEDFKEHHEVSWCADKIYDSDLEYFSREAFKKILQDKIKEIQSNTSKIELHELLFQKG